MCLPTQSSWINSLTRANSTNIWSRAMSIMAENNLCITGRPNNMNAESMPQKRPFRVTLLLWLVLSLSAWGAVRLFATFRWWSVLNEFGARLSPLYLSITGAGWIVVGGVLLWGLFRGKRWTRLAIAMSI